MDDLVAVSVTYQGFDGATHNGVIVIQKRFGDDIAAIFKELYAIRFPIHNVSTYENYEVGKSAYSDATVGFYSRLCTLQRKRPNLLASPIRAS